MDEKKFWEEKLKQEGLSKDLDPIFPGKQVELGDGLGRKTEKEENIEDSGKGHSRMCPLNLGKAMTDEIDQPTDNFVHKKIENKNDKDNA